MSYLLTGNDGDCNYIYNALCLICGFCSLCFQNVVEKKLSQMILDKKLHGEFTIIEIFSLKNIPAPRNLDTVKTRIKETAG